jgi:predicted MFS family arabinose efflux permease
MALTATLAACALAPTLLLLFVARALSGAAGGGIFPLSFALIGDNVPLAQRQVALSRFLLFGLIGQVSGGALSAFLGPVIGWRGVTACCAAAAAVALLVLWRTPLAAEPTTPLRLDQSLRRYRDILRSPVARTCYAGVLIEGALVFAVLPFLVPLLAARGLGGTQAAGLAVGAFGGGGLAYVLLAPLLVARLGPRRMFVAGGVGCAIAFVLLAVATEAAAVVSATLLLGCAFLTMHNTIQVRVTEVAPAARGSAVALHAFSFFVGQSLGPPLFSAGIAIAGPVPVLVAMAVSIAGLGLVLARLIGRPPPVPD